MLRRFRHINLATLIVLYLLIFLGGIVRSTGAGMGCPDWPRCFDQWVPPTEVSQLPEDYQQRYADHGYASMAFNPVKTWTEYINRLFGALTGLFIIATLVASWPLRREHPLLFRLSALNLVLVLFQGWLGSVVVRTNLADIVISLHFAVAFIIVTIASITFWKALLLNFPEEYQLVDNRKGVVRWGLFVMAVTLLQVFLGTSLRAEVNHAIEVLGPQNPAQWLSMTGSVFTFHKLWAYATWVVNLLFGLKLLRTPLQKLDQVLALGMMVTVSLQAVMGASLAVWDFPAVPQALHVMMAALLFGFQISIVLKHQLRPSTPSEDGLRATPVLISRQNA